MKSTKTTYLVRIALLMAITIVLAATPLGYIPAGVLSFTSWYFLSQSAAF